MLLNNYWVNEEIIGQTKKYLKANENKNTLKSVKCSKSGPKKEVYGNTGLPQETRKISNNINLNLRKLEKRTNKPKVRRRKKIIKIRVKISEIEI